MNNLGIQNNRFHQKALQSRINTENNYQMPKKRNRNQYYEKWLQQKQLESNISTETCLDTITPNLPQAKIPNSFEVKLIKDILSKNS